MERHPPHLNRQVSESRQKNTPGCHLGLLYWEVPGFASWMLLNGLFMNICSPAMQLPDDYVTGKMNCFNVVVSCRDILHKRQQIIWLIFRISIWLTHNHLIKCIFLEASICPDLVALKPAILNCGHVKSCQITFHLWQSCELMTQWFPSSLSVFSLAGQSFFLLCFSVYPTLLFKCIPIYASPA